jgi:hypothetical protein
MGGGAGDVAGEGPGAAAPILAICIIVVGLGLLVVDLLRSGRRTDGTVCCCAPVAAIKKQGEDESDAEQEDKVETDVSDATAV